MSAAHELAGWIFKNYPYNDKHQITHLKIQKLCFYSYGALLSRDLEGRLEAKISFEAWEHGPVSSELYRTLKVFGSGPITHLPQAGNFQEDAEHVLSCALKIYGALDAWSLRQQSHLEAPWKESFGVNDSLIDPIRMKEHFIRKFSQGEVLAPEYLFGLGSFRVDGIPVQPYRSLEDLAEAAVRISKDIKS